MFNKLKRVISGIFVVSLMVALLSGCSLSSQHVEVAYDENNNENLAYWDEVTDANVITWDDASIVYWSDVDDYSDAVYTQILFDNITSDYPIVECKVLDFQTNGTYFDGEKIYQLVNDDFDVNSFIAKYAVGTGVIVICVVLTVATAGGTTPICCFVAGAAEGSATMAVKMAAFSAAINAVDEAVKGGSLEDMMYGAIEGSADGYAYGAIFGAITGGLSSKYCFTEDTLVSTENGLVPISEISVGDMIYSYDEETDSFLYEEVTQIMDSTTNETVSVIVGEDKIVSTPNHPYLTRDGWVEARCLAIGDYIYTESEKYEQISYVDYESYEREISVYNLCINNSHTYCVGEAGIVVHNRCKPNEKYANDTYYFKKGTPQAKNYPNGIPFDADGYPIFDDYAKYTVKFDYPSLEGRADGTCLVGNCTSDFDLANKAAGLPETPPGMTWHHHQDMQTMQLVPQDLHSPGFGGAAHAGGESLLEAFWEACKVVM